MAMTCIPMSQKVTSQMSQMQKVLYQVSQRASTKQLQQNSSAQNISRGLLVNHVVIIESSLCCSVLMRHQEGRCFCFPPEQLPPQCGMVGGSVGTINTHCGYNHRILGSGSTHSTGARVIPWRVNCTYFILSRVFRSSRVNPHIGDNEYKLQLSQLRLHTQCHHSC